MRANPRKFTSLATNTQISTSCIPGTVHGGLHTVTLIPGDGIGREMAKSVQQIFTTLKIPVEFEQFDLSGNEMVVDELLLKRTMDSIRRNKVALKGILHTPLERSGHRSLNIGMRKELDIYASMAMIKNFEGKFPVRHTGVDIALIRENTEGFYTGLEHSPIPGVVETLKVVTKKNTERIAQFAFDFAVKNKRKKVTAIHKANIMKLADGLFLNVCRDVAKSYESSGITFSDMIVDNAAMQFVAKPQQFDVVVCGNLYGNILTNIGAALIGGPGMVPGANVGRDYIVFEPGCRHVGLDIQDKNQANPTSLIMSAVNMLRHFGLHHSADQINTAVTRVIREGKYVTKDLNGTSTSTDFTKAVIGYL